MCNTSSRNRALIRIDAYATDRRYWESFWYSGRESRGISDGAVS